jgi:hypothetical protein
MPGPPADDDLHLAADLVKDHLESREAHGDVQHRGYHCDRQQQDARKEEPHHDVHQAEIDQPVRRRHRAQLARHLPGFSGHTATLAFIRERHHPP